MFTQEQKERIISALKERAPQAGACPVCHRTQWTISEGMVYLTIQQQTRSINIGGPGYPMAAIICTNCGNTQFLNLIVLGLKDMSEPPKDPGNG